MTHALDQSIVELLDASRDDEETTGLAVNDRTFGFHVQQAVEKLLKALIGAHGKEFEFTHDIARLVRHVQRLGEEIPVPIDPIERLTDFAGIWRYQLPEPIADQERVVLRTHVLNLRGFVLGRIAVLRPGRDWSRWS